MPNERRAIELARQAHVDAQNAVRVLDEGSAGPSILEGTHYQDVAAAQTAQAVANLAAAIAVLAGSDDGFLQEKHADDE